MRRAPQTKTRVLQRRQSSNEPRGPRQRSDGTFAARAPKEHCRHSRFGLGRCGKFGESRGFRIESGLNGSEAHSVYPCSLLHSAYLRVPHTLGVLLMCFSAAKSLGKVAKQYCLSPGCLLGRYPRHSLSGFRLLRSGSRTSAPSVSMVHMDSSCGGGTQNRVRSARCYVGCTSSLWPLACIVVGRSLLLLGRSLSQLRRLLPSAPRSARSY